ncbi:potassium channel KAT3-like protein [Tanacetum coccineum]|uniref:Potassium channel KAT3-like protein n=1 Tax=Tanacetum coccineum TaxID=301880 RepID=A0ABQ5GRZ5_9ASTR
MAGCSMLKQCSNMISTDAPSSICTLRTRYHSTSTSTTKASSKRSGVKTGGNAYVLFCGGGSRMVTAGVDRSAAPIVPVFLFAGIHPGSLTHILILLVVENYAYCSGVKLSVYRKVCGTLQGVILVPMASWPPMGYVLDELVNNIMLELAGMWHVAGSHMDGWEHHASSTNSGTTYTDNDKEGCNTLLHCKEHSLSCAIHEDNPVWSILKPGFMALLEDTIVFYVLPPSNEDKEYQICTKHSRNVLDMNAHSGGFNFALLQAGKSAWVMNVVLPGSKKTINKSLLNKDEINVKVPAEEGQTAHHVAVNKGHLEMVMIFLDGGANVSKADVKGSTPKPLAKKQENKSIYDLFLPVQIKSSASYVVEASSSIRFEERGIVNKETAMASQPLDPIDNPVVDTDAQTGIR